MVNIDCEARKGRRLIDHIGLCTGSDPGIVSIAYCKLPVAVSRVSEMCRLFKVNCDHCLVDAHK